MFNYLAMMMTISSIFLIIDGSPEALGKKTQLWEYPVSYTHLLLPKLEQDYLFFQGMFQNGRQTP